MGWNTHAPLVLRGDLKSLLCEHLVVTGFPFEDEGGYALMLVVVITIIIIQRYYCCVPFRMCSSRRSPWVFTSLFILLFG